MKIEHKIACFFIVFGSVYFLESIGGFYMTSAVVFIEKQFQIPSRLSGTMVSAGDFAYIPVVVFTSYFGGKGNRARWIGGGCMLIAIANLLISSSNFLFPVEELHVNSSYISSSLAYEVNRFVLNTSSDPKWFSRTLKEVDPNGTALSTHVGPYHSESEDFIKYQSFCFYNPDSEICSRMEDRVSKEHAVNERDVSAVRLLTSLPYSFCHNLINKLRQEHKADECKKETSSLGPFAMIFGGLMLLGVGRTMPFSLGLPLMDDNVKKNNLPVYFACMFFVKILGPVIGLLVGSKLNEIYYTFDPPQGLTPLDPMWIGCWWLGFLIFGALLFFPSLALFLFPSDKLDEGEITEAITREKSKLGDDSAPIKPKKRLNLRDKHVKVHEDHVTSMEKVTEFFGVVRGLFRNPIYVGAMLGRIVDVLAFKGFFVFLGKYLEIQFGVPQFRIQKYLATTGVVGFAIGVIIGSFCMRKFRLQGRKAAGWVAFCSLVSAAVSFLNASVGCKSVIGEIGDQGVANNFSFPSCRPDCLCEGMPFYPVCNNKGDIFYSPCQAGCPLSGANFTIFSKMEKGTPLVFTECECAGSDNFAVSRDYCPVEHCNSQFNTFFFNQALGAVFGGLSVVPGMLIVLRSVPPEHRSISLGFNGFLVSLLATLPSPVFWGKIFDMSCLMWQNLCSKTGACPIYNTDELRIRIHLIYGGLRVLSLLSDIWVVYWAKGLKLVDEEEEKKKEDGSVRELELLNREEHVNPKFDVPNDEKILKD
ncbi:unnamed protein product [Cylicocyclus nassatus]|uniref:Solute carrier organic anion transporter family member n=1 Tax=Cylicocyclus nassatus TaxID=53992 RepID=A0AA36DNM1_CYLNA|nr:unnamed protein product [Cylicocyclus nassatus]